MRLRNQCVKTLTRGQPEQQIDSEAKNAANSRQICINATRRIRKVHRDSRETSLARKHFRFRFHM